MNILRNSFAVAAIVAACVLSAFTATRAGTLPDIEGVWYAQGNATKVCHVAQSGLNVTMVNELGDKATGKFTDPSTLSMSWPDWHNSMGAGPRSTYVGRISNDLNTIHWSNGTYWTRHHH